MRWTANMYMSVCTRGFFSRRLGNSFLCARARLRPTLALVPHGLSRRLHPERNTLSFFSCVLAPWKVVLTTSFHVILLSGTIRLVSSRLALVRPVRVHAALSHSSQLTYAPL